MKRNDIWWYANKKMFNTTAVQFSYLYLTTEESSCSEILSSFSQE
jgi:hypothetical protein